MDHASFTNNLTTLFQDISLYGLTDDSSEAVQEVLTFVLDSNDATLFKNLTLTNLIYLLDLNNSSILIKHLITEFKLKSLRLIYMNKMSGADH